MKNIVIFLTLTLALTILGELKAAEASPLRVEFSHETGLVKFIRADDAASMNWVGFHDRWGEPMARGRALKPSEVAITPEGARAVWSDGTLAVEIVRTPSADFRQWHETYRFRNLGATPLSFKTNDLAIRVPLADDYKSGAAVCLNARCHAHLWAEGSSAWICAMQMNSKPPHLGIVLTQGQLDGYSIIDRELNSNDRGVFAIHPASTEIPANGSMEIGWTIFTHQGWDDFFAKAKLINPAFIRLSADRYSVSLGEPIRLSVDSATSLHEAVLSVDGEPIKADNANGCMTCSFTPAKTGEHLVELKLKGRREKLVVLVTPKPEDLLRARAEFLLNKKQLLDPQSPHDGSFPVLDLDTGEFVFDGNPDHNSSRERMGSGVFIGLMWQRTPEGAFRDRLKASFLRFYAFINREIQDKDGVVANGVQDFKHIRRYNFPWAAHTHLCAWRITQDKACLQRLMANLRNLYGKRNGHRFYVVSQPISETLSALNKAGMMEEYQEALAMFRKHADTIINTGNNIPRHEVAYEQGIMGPAMQIISETAFVTGEKNYLAGAETFRPMLEAFGGRQPHYRLYDIGIRHWDGYFFGKPRAGGQLYGDVMPHYWSTITAEAFRFYAAAAKRPEYFGRARQILLANFSQYDSHGAGHCAYLYPRSINGTLGQYQDPYDNDQDWTLVHYLLFEQMLNNLSVTVH